MMENVTVTSRSAVLSGDRQYLYRLDREWFVEGSGKLMWVMLNPSAADERMDDPTIKRCIALSEGWYFEKMAVGNLFALRSANPAELLAHPDPVGPENDRYLREMSEEFDVIVAGWGSSVAHSAVFVKREREVKNILRDRLYCMEITAKGNPKHPSRIRSDIEFKPFRV